MCWGAVASILSEGGSTVSDFKTPTLTKPIGDVSCDSDVWNQATYVPFHILTFSALFAIYALSVCIHILARLISYCKTF